MAFRLLWAPSLLIGVTHGHLRLTSADANDWRKKKHRHHHHHHHPIAALENTSIASNASSEEAANNASSKETEHNSSNASREEAASVSPRTSYQKAKQPEVHMLSFSSCSQTKEKQCNSRRFKALKTLSNHVVKLPIFSRHHLFETLPDEIFENPKWSRHVKEDPLVKGRGYWFWKPALFNYLVRKGEMKLGDIVVWMDADDPGKPNRVHWSRVAAGITNDGWQRRLSCASANSKGGYDFFIESLFRCEKQWTKGDIFQKFNTTPQDSYYGQTAQFEAGFWIASVNERTLKFMEMYEDLMSDIHLCSDEKSTSPNDRSFRSNRHDQSILSMLTKAQGPPIHDDGWSKKMRYEYEFGVRTAQASRLWHSWLLCSCLPNVKVHWRQRFRWFAPHGYELPKLVRGNGHQHGR